MATTEDTTTLVFNVTEFRTGVSRFHIVDYVIFVLMLCVSLGIGFFYACTGGKQKTASEYLVGNRKMGKFPITMSLIASFMSSIAMLGMPSEIYNFGIGYLVKFFGMLCALPIAGFVFLPMFYDLQLTSTIEYIERRFSKRLRYLSSTLFIVAMTVYAAFVIYGPAISLRQVTGINIWGSILTIGLVGTIYTSVGGIKAVMWTDVVQVILMIASLIVVCVKGTLDVGGFNKLISTNIEGDRIHMLSFSLDPRIRYTVWGCLISPIFLWCTIYGVYQTQVQRYLSAPTKKAAQQSLWYNIPGLGLLYILCSYIGFIVYTKYRHCDPISNKQLEAPDQVTPLFVMETMSATPGIPGLYVAGIFSGSLSTISSVFNSLAAIVLEDFVKQTSRWKDINEEQAAKISKIIALSFGLLSFFLASLGDFLGTVIQSSNYNINVFTSVYFGIFVLGMFFPWTTSKGVWVGVCAGLSFGFWLSIGSQRARYKPLRPPMSVAGCPNNLFNITEPIPMTSPENEEIFELYKISYVWFTVLVVSIVVITGLVGSFATGANGINDVDPKYLTCVTKYFLKLFFKGKYKPEEFQMKLDKQIAKDGTNDPLMVQNGTSVTLELDSVCEGAILRNVSKDEVNENMNDSQHELSKDDKNK